MKRILIVDDDETLLELMKRILHGKFHVITAVNGEEGVKAYEKENPDLVLMDMKMPKMNGVEAAKRILNADPNAKIIVITGYADGDVRELLKQGAVDLLEKPFTRKELIEMIERHI